MTSLNAEVEQRVRLWLTDDFDSKTRNIVQELLDKEKYEELNDAFYRDLEFGTGGLRGIMGAGTNRVNKYTIGVATQGLCNYLKKTYPAERIKVVIAHDNRNNAEYFAGITADVFSANGIYVYLFDKLRPTPELSYAIRELQCHSGIMLTASHNPKEYSGYKAYWSDGCQVVPPHDKNIIAEVNNISSVAEVRFERDPANVEEIGQQMDELFIGSLKKAITNPTAIKDQHDLNIVFSPIHGTAVDLVPRTLREAGFTNVNLVAEQCTPDGDFPTVVYPNPEEKEALSMAIHKAQQLDADLVMATDPDADRVGIAVKNTYNDFELLNGNQTGTLLFHYLMNAWEKAGKLDGKQYIVKTIVTTYLIDKIAGAKGVKCYNVLTGFKYIGTLMTELQGKEEFIAGAEESYGYLIGDHVRDKDAVVACLVIAEMAAYYKGQGKSLYQVLQEIYTEYGFYKEFLISRTKSGQKGAEEIRQLMSGFRENPPEKLAGKRVLQVLDYQTSIAKNLENGSESVIDLPKSNVLQFVTEGDYLVSARPSGTEPKIKFYISVNDQLDNVADYASKEAELNMLAEQIMVDLKL